jgi:hypothetical protein
MTKAVVILIVVMTASALAFAQEPSVHTIAYCPELKRLAALAATKERFAAIAAQPRQGNFVDTSLTLTGWRDCVLYGSRTYACDSREWNTVAEAETAQATFMQDIKDCLGDGWRRVEDRSSLGYGVLHDLQHPISITLSFDRTDGMKHVVRFILFIRGSETPR